MSLSRWRSQFEAYRTNLGERGQEFELALSAFLQNKRRHALDNVAKGDGARRAITKRLAREASSKILSSVYPDTPRKVVKSPNLLLYRRKPSLLRDRLCPEFEASWLEISQRLRARGQDRIRLTDFSFARNPTGTLKQLRTIVERAATCIELKLDFVDEVCDDVAPYIVLAHLMQGLPPVFTGGTINHEVAAVVEAVGLDRPLGINYIGGSEHRKKLILPFRMMRRVPPGFFGDQDHQLRPQYKELVADRFCTALDTWLSTHDFELTPEAAESLVSSITEALDNAERHGAAEVDGGMGDWSMAGFSRLVVTPARQTRLECSVAIVSVGSTISQSLQTASGEVSSRIDSYVHAHSGVFAPGLGRRKLLRTVMALQDGVTRVEAASSAGRGGVGMMTLANLFAELGDTDEATLESIFTILSGDSCLRVTAPYRNGSPREGSTMRELWFNDTNGPEEPPSPNHAFTASEEFAGTVLSACFTIDPDYVQRRSG